MPDVQGSDTGILQTASDNEDVRSDRPGSPSVGRESEGKGSPSKLAGVKWSAYAGIAMLAVVVLVFSIWVPDSFLTSGTLKTILQTQALTAVLALGLLFPLSAGVYDLSVAQNLGLSGVVCSWLLTSQGLSIPVAIVLTLGLGIIIGAFNGFLVTIVGVDSFIATLATTSLLLALQTLIADGKYIGPVPSGFSAMTGGSVLGIPAQAVYMLAIALVVWYVLEHTPVGRRIQATGTNPQAARLAGLRTTRMMFWCMVVSAVVASFAGILYASTIGTTNQNDGPAYLLPAFAAVFLGATMIKIGMFNVWGTLLAVYLLGTGVQGLQLVGGTVWLTQLFNGTALILAVSIAVISERRQGGQNLRKLVRWRPRSSTRAAGGANTAATTQ